MRHLYRAALACAAATLLAAEPLPSSPVQLLSDLGSRHHTIRERAERDLEALGPRILPLLEAASSTRDPEVRRRLEGLRERLENQVLAARLLPPTRTRFTFRDVTLRQAIDEIVRKHGHSVALSAETERQMGHRLITVDTGEGAYWEVFDRFCRHTGLTTVRNYSSAAEPATFQVRGFSPPSDAATLLESRADHPPGPTARVGAVQVRAIRARLIPAGPRGPGEPAFHDPELALSVEVTLDPEVDQHRLDGIQLTRALDDRGWTVGTFVERKLGDEEAPSPAEPPMFMMRARPLIVPHSTSVRRAVPLSETLRLNYPSGARLLRELTGRVRVAATVPASPVLSVEDVLQDAGKAQPGRHGGVLKVTRAQRTREGNLELTVLVEMPPTVTALHQQPGPFLPGGQPGPVPLVFLGAGPGPGSHGPASNAFLLTDAEGRRLEHTVAYARPPEEGDREVWEYALECRAPARGEPVRLALIGTRQAVVDIPFTLRDLPLPVER